MDIGPQKIKAINRRIQNNTLTSKNCEMVTENKLKNICNLIICLKGNSTALVMDNLRMNDISQLDKFIKREEIKSLQGRRQM